MFFSGRWLNECLGYVDVLAGQNILLVLMKVVGEF